MENQNPKENKRKAIALLVVALIAVVAMIAGATYAYFQAQQGKGQSSDVNVTTGTTDNLNFNITDLDVTRTDIVDENNDEVPITINASMENFTDNDTSLGDGVTATATLIANDATNEAHDSYNVYLNITKNELQYSSYKRNEPLEPDTNNKNTLVFKTKEEKSAAELGEYSPIPELYLTIKKNGEEITSGVTINDEELTHETEILVDPENADDSTGKTLGGFDITEASGLIKIKTNETIDVIKETEDNTTVDTWEIIVTFMNLETDQNLNTGKELTGEVLIQKDIIATNLVEACTGKEFSDCIKNNYKFDTAIYYHDGSIPINNNGTDAHDESYRYVGTDPNNYVCLEKNNTNTGTCTETDLYRIIGIFKNKAEGYELKLIKSTIASGTELGTNGAAITASTANTKFSWNTSLGATNEGNANMWQYSNLNKTNLNQNYYDYLTNADTGRAPYLKDNNLLIEHKWITIGSNLEYEAYAYNMYTNEVGDSYVNGMSESDFCYSEGTPSVERTCTDEDTYFTDEIGLMYVSDYMYAASPEAWGNYSQYYDYAKDENWMYSGVSEWTITRTFMSQGLASRYIYESGATNNYGDDIKNGNAVRPTFYLASKTVLNSGDGTKNNPFRIG